MALSGDRAHPPSNRSTGEVGFCKAYFYFPLSAKRTSVPVLLYKALPKWRTAANLADFGVDCRLGASGGSPAQKRR
jgi:hypothetical protein